MPKLGKAVSGERTMKLIEDLATDDGQVEYAKLVRMLRIEPDIHRYRLLTLLDWLVDRADFIVKETAQRWPATRQQAGID